jgi:hypothetical protein
LPRLAGVPDIAVRVKMFDYGVVSLRLSVPFRGSWDDFGAFTRELRRDAQMFDHARIALEAVLREIQPALDDPHEPLLEEYFVYEVERFARPMTAAELLGPQGAALARLVLGEERPLMSEEAAEALRVHFAYFEDELVVVQWDSAFVYDATGSAEAVEDILEFANTQLVELRTYDARLDEELDAIYAAEPERRSRHFFGARAAERAEELRFLIVDVLELTDRASNALKIIGDAYFSRLYRATSTRLGLADWQRQVDAKLRSVGELYRFAQDRAQHSRAELLEIIVIALILLEVVLGVLALHH